MKSFYDTVIHDVIVDYSGTKEKMEVLEEKSRATKGVKNYSLGDVVGLCLVLNVIIPAKFKVLEFE